MKQHRLLNPLPSENPVVKAEAVVMEEADAGANDAGEPVEGDNEKRTMDDDKETLVTAKTKGSEADAEKESDAETLADHDGKK